ncbi:MAG: NAD(+)/NADH kinase [Thermoleophilaceae bacterium]
MTAPGSITVFTRRVAGEDTARGLQRLAELAEEAGVRLRVPPEEVDKHGLDSLAGAELGADPDGDTDLAVALGGDGTILAAMRRYAGRRVPVFAINFGAIGFLATVERDGLDSGIWRALRGEFDVLPLPALQLRSAAGEWLAVNDVSFHRRQDLRVAKLGYSVLGEEVGQVRCDGLVISTPAGSTGYNLANGGPVMAWGVEGYVVSFIAPHTLSARALVVAPDDPLEVVNESPDEPVDVTTDGRTICSLAPNERIEVRFCRDMALLAQVAGATFYHRLRDKFGNLTR